MNKFLIAIGGNTYFQYRKKKKHAFSYSMTLLCDNRRIVLNDYQINFWRGTVFANNFKYAYQKKQKTTLILLKKRKEKICSTNIRVVILWDLYFFHNIKTFFVWESIFVNTSATSYLNQIQRNLVSLL